MQNWKSVLDRDEFWSNGLSYLHKNQKEISVNVANITDNVKVIISNLMDYNIMKENDCIEPLVEKIVSEPTLLSDKHFEDMQNIVKVEEAII